MNKFYFKFSNKKQIFFVKRLSFLIKAGVPVLECIRLIKHHTKSKKESEIFHKVASNIENGQSLSVSLNHNPPLFGDFAINVIRAGEMSGTLVENLSYLAEELKKKNTLRKKIISAMLYPLIITLATLCITGFLIIYIFPKIIPVFSSLNAELPLSTKMIIFLSDTVRHYGIYIFLILIFLTIGFYFTLKKSPKIKFAFDRMILKFPFTGKISRDYNLINITRTLGLLLGSNIPLPQAILITADTTMNTNYKKALQDIYENILKGKNISESMDSELLFPDIARQMILVGERSGNLRETFLYLSEFYENEFEDLTKNLSSAIEPVLMIVMGLIVGFIVISVITPIYQITNSLRG